MGVDGNEIPRDVLDWMAGLQNVKVFKNNILEFFIRHKVFVKKKKIRSSKK